MYPKGYFSFHPTTPIAHQAGISRIQQHVHQYGFPNLAIDPEFLHVPKETMRKVKNTLLNYGSFTRKRRKFNIIYIREKPVEFQNLTISCGEKREIAPMEG